MDLVDIAAWLQLALIPAEDHGLADGVRAALDMDAVYAAMGMEKH